MATNFVRTVFEEDEAGRASAEEVLEGVLLAAQRTFEERKLRYVGKLYGGIAFDPLIDRSTANTLVDIMRQLTYRQVTLLALFGFHDGPRHGTLGLRAAMYDEQIPGSNLDEVLAATFALIAPRWGQAVGSASSNSGSHRCGQLVGHW